MAPALALLLKASGCSPAVQHMVCNAERCMTMPQQCDEAKPLADKLNLMIKTGARHTQTGWERRYGTHLAALAQGCHTAPLGGCELLEGVGMAVLHLGCRWTLRKQ